MAGTRSTNTMQEGLGVLLDDITAMKMTPDADLQWLVQLEAFVLQKARQPFEAQRQAQQQLLASAAGGSGGSGTVLPGGGGGLPPGMPPSQQPTPGNLRANPQVPTDTIQRLLAATRQ